MDLDTRFAYGYPVKPKDNVIAERCLGDFCGSDAIAWVYSDGHESIIAAAEAM